MFHTFQVAEPGEDLPGWQQSGIYDFFSFDDLLSLKSLKLVEDEIIALRVERMKQNGIRVPQDFKKLEDAVALVHLSAGLAYYTEPEYNAKYADTVNEKRFSTIVVGKGEHKIDGDYLMVYSAMNIVGDPEVAREDIVVLGGIRFVEGIPGNCHLQHLTLRKAKYEGVRGESSFTMDDVLVEQCGGQGVAASGAGVVGRCTNVEVRQCRLSGVYASKGASIILIGAKTAVHHNCTQGLSYNYGLTIGFTMYGAKSTILLVSPLTKEQVSRNNDGGGNWGAIRCHINQIKTIPA